MGFDVFPDFIKATKVRLLLLAKMKTTLWNPAIVAVDNYFPLIRVQDFLEDTSGLEKASHIVINPPYSKIMAPDDCKWANKKISAASLFIERCISNANANAKIRAILPDVLRTGSSYLKWREQVGSSSRNVNISIYGQFDEWTDVDVFILRLQKLLRDKRILNSKWNTCLATESTLVNYFDVRVGPVVPHRDPEKGPLLAYLHARTATAWKELNHIFEKRKYAGTVFSPPFVVVRRTSRPGEKRAIGAIVKGKRKVAVENHLLVLLPKKKSIEECRKLLRTLKSQETDDWFNQRIRCRHLTVEAMKELPYGG